jgi:hypothetical protein
MPKEVKIKSSKPALSKFGKDRGEENLKEQQTFNLCECNGQ